MIEKQIYVVPKKAENESINFRIRLILECVLIIVFSISLKLIVSNNSLWDLGVILASIYYYAYSLFKKSLAE